ncbi:hypothetical protein [Qipengyuania sp. 902]|uniref:hypothetical protein n=1 Tax=Qipengyuania sp. 902 TaxID=3417565 RepID=UPI003EB8F689
MARHLWGIYSLHSDAYPTAIKSIAVDDSDIRAGEAISPSGQRTSIAERIKASKAAKRDSHGRDHRLRVSPSPLLPRSARLRFGIGLGKMAANQTSPFLPEFEDSRHCSIYRLRESTGHAVTEHLQL